MVFFNFNKNTANDGRGSQEVGTQSNSVRFFISIYFLLIVFFFIFTLLSKTGENLSKFDDQISAEQNLIDKFFENLKNPYLDHKYVIKSNDTIQNILKKYNINNKEINLIIQKLKKEKLSKIYTGRELSLLVKKNIENENSLVILNIPINNTLSVEIQKKEGDFVLNKKILKLFEKEIVSSGEIKDNLYSAAVRAGIEPNIIIEFARIYGFEIDFQRDIRKGDKFTVYYERLVDSLGEIQDTGKIIYTSMKVNNREINLYNFDWDNEIGYYDINGKSIVKSLMKTPINGARLSSSFGNRKHPILGYTRLHAGTDFAAPEGTPIMASGSGTVTRSRWCGGGGNCVKIRHNSTYETVYAHMKNFAKGIREGVKVKQGQIIGYVGSTGLSTGPHLHYEVHINKKKVNSQKLKLPSGKILKGEARKEFEIERIKIDLKLSEKIKKFN
tara:strand:+ start:276 stop:1604 length:1329 start_codon:yes stop_codon:yes gene_type:complete